MISVVVGIKNFKGIVYMTYTQYLQELQKGGEKYHSVYCNHGVERFRIKYMREVQSA